MKTLEDLNAQLEDPAIEVGPVSVYFRDMAQQMEKFIAESEAVVGCVAWLTSPQILEALTKLECVSLVLAKEDFLKPDSKTAKGIQLHEAYGKMTGIVRFHHKPVSSLCAGGDGYTEPLRCLGTTAPYRNRPRLHHKFLVRLERGFRRWTWVPTAVWTGSFNPTNNGAVSLENAVVIRNFKVARAFYWEWGQALAISEPLDWESPWVAPEYRIGS